MNRKFWLIGLLAAVAVLAGWQQNLNAQSDAIASGDWSAVGTWSPAEPGAATIAEIDGGFTVDVDQAGEVAGILDLGTLFFESGNLTVDAPGSLTVSTTLRVGEADTATGNVTMTGGAVTVNGAFGSGFGDGDLIVGEDGNGTWTQSGGDTNVADEIIIGLVDTSTGVVSVSGGNFRANGRSILVGFDGNGTLNVSGTGNVSANFDMLVGFIEGGVGNVNLSGGTIEAGFLFTNSFTGPAGSTANMTQTGGTFTARIAYVLGQSNGTTTQNHSGGVIDVLNNGEFVVGDGGGNSSTYNISGTADVNVARNFVAGRDGIGVVNMSGGTIDAVNVFLGDFDSSQGTMTISGGALNLTGDLNVGAALASNAPAAAVRLEPSPANGPQGQALDANGTLIVDGSLGVIDVAGNMLANPADKSPFRNGPGQENDSLLRFVLDSTGVSTIDVGLVADLDGAVIDIDDTAGYFAANPGSSLTLIDAAGGFGNVFTVTAAEAAGNGRGFSLAAGDDALYKLTILPSGLGEQLVLMVIPEPAGFVLLSFGLAGLWGSRRHGG